MVKHIEDDTIRLVFDEEESKRFLEDCGVNLLNGVN